jgi:lipoprotein-anchoring transpeptidase ErfK/SrfK
MEEADQVRVELEKIGNETVFSARILPGDALVNRYVIRIGDNLAKIANQHVITADLLASINGIADKHRIREGQVIKVIHGPVRAVVYKKAYRLDVYVGDVLVRSYPVGLGADDSTPTGEWRVKNKLENPTYYPPRGGAIVSADDPANPLGERWIGLEGVAGEALSQERYGVHGTNEPDSIGKSVSLGCVRMQNRDVEQLYSYLVEGRSTVTIVE